MRNNGDSSDQLAVSIWESYESTTGLPRDTSPGHFTEDMFQYYALNWLPESTPAVILEMGWLCDDLPTLLYAQDMVAYGIANGIATYLKPESKYQQVKIGDPGSLGSPKQLLITFDPNFWNPECDYESCETSTLTSKEINGCSIHDLTVKSVRDVYRDTRDYQETIGNYSYYIHYLEWNHGWIDWIVCYPPEYSNFRSCIEIGYYEGSEINYSTAEACINAAREVIQLSEKEMTK